MNYNPSDPDIKLDVKPPVQWITPSQAEVKYDMSASRIKRICNNPEIARRIQAKPPEKQGLPWSINQQLLEEYLIESQLWIPNSQPKTAVDNNLKSRSELIEELRLSIQRLDRIIEQKDLQINSLLEVSKNSQVLLLNSQKTIAYNPSENGFVVVDDKTPTEDIKPPENVKEEVKPKKSKLWRIFWSR